MSILSVDNISPIGSGTSVTVNSAATLVLTNANSTGVVTATSFVGSGANLTGVLSNIVEDTSPQLGGNLDTNSHEISLDTSHAINFGDSNELKVFYHSGNGQIDFNGTTSIQLKTPANKYFQVLNRDTGDNIIQCQAGGTAQLYHNGSKKFETASYGTSTTGDIYLTGNLLATTDTSKLLMGGANDLQIYHDGSHSYIKDAGTCNLILLTSKLNINNADNTIAFLHTSSTDGIELYHNNSIKFETMSTGAIIQGGLLFNSDTAAANNLDDYEEGTWTATLSGNSSPANVALNNPTTTRAVTGTYRKIGSLVHVQALWNNLHYNASNDMHNHQLQHITGIPFTSGNASGTSVFTSPLGYSRGIYGRYSNTIYEECVMYFWLGTSSTTVYLQASQIVQNSPGTLYHTVSNSSSNMYYAFNMTYHTN